MGEHLVSESRLLQRDREGWLLLYKSMKPEERLLAHLRHSQLIYQFYLAGVKRRNTTRNTGT